MLIRTVNTFPWGELSGGAQVIRATRHFVSPIPFYAENSFQYGDHCDFVYLMQTLKHSLHSNRCAISL